MHTLLFLLPTHIKICRPFSNCQNMLLTTSKRNLKKLTGAAANLKYTACHSKTPISIFQTILPEETNGTFHLSDRKSDLQWVYTPCYKTTSWTTCISLQIFIKTRLSRQELCISATLPVSYYAPRWWDVILLPFIFQNRNEEKVVDLLKIVISFENI